MPESKHADELAELRAELQKAAAASTARSAPDPEPPAAESSEIGREVERLLHELQSALSERAEGAEEVIAEHPLPAVAAAFLLGLAVGWIARRS